MWRHVLTVLVFAYICVESSAQQATTCPIQDTDAALARYIFELWSSRQANCKDPINFVRNEKDLGYKVESLCKQAQGDVTTYKAQYRGKSCDGGKDDMVDITFKTQTCFGEPNPLLTPMRVIKSSKKKIPKTFSCPAETAEVMFKPDETNPFSLDKEFSRQVMNVYRYSLQTRNDGTAKGGCNAYIVPSIQKACYNPVNGEFEGYGLLKVSCVGSKKSEDVSVYLRAIDLGRSSCPSPEILEGSPGYDPQFNFIKVTDDSGSLLIPVGGLSPELPAPSPPVTSPPPLPSPPVAKPLPPKALSDTEKLQNATQCLIQGGVDVTTNLEEVQVKSQVWNKLNDTVALAVVEPKSMKDVASALECLYDNGIRAVPKSGGLSTGGYSVLSTAVTIDLNKLNKVTLNQDSTVLVEAGTRLGDLYSSVQEASGGKYAVVGGTFPAVAVGGHFLGGGIGILSRQSGLACDQVLKLTMVNYRGEILNVSASENPDVFWASCGGGGGNFGIVTDYTIKTVNVPEKITTFEFSIDEANAAEFMLSVQNNVTNAASRLLSGIYLKPQNKGVLVQGVYLGLKDNLDVELQTAGLLAFPTSQIKATKTDWIGATVGATGLPYITKPKQLTNNLEIESKSRNYFTVQSQFVIPSNPFPLEAFQEIIDWASSSPNATAEIQVLGPKSKIAEVASEATAYPYRTALLSIQFGAQWDDPKDTDKNIKLVQGLQTKLDTFAKGVPGRMINYLDPQTPNLENYYGANLQQLESVKAAYDPQNYFKFPLGIPVSGVSEELVPVPAASTSSSLPSGPTPSEASAPDQAGVSFSGVSTVVDLPWMGLSLLLIMLLC